MEQIEKVLISFQKFFTKSSLDNRTPEGQADQKVTRFSTSWELDLLPLSK